MKKIIFTTFAIAVLFVTFTACSNQTPASSTAEVKSDEKVQYTCTMHPEVLTDKPGDCPICGMALVKVEPADTTRVQNQPDTMHMK
jgi:hypothetical protein